MKHIITEFEKYNETMNQDEFNKKYGDKTINSTKEEDEVYRKYQCAVELSGKFNKYLVLRSIKSETDEDGSGYIKFILKIPKSDFPHYTKNDIKKDVTEETGGTNIGAAGQRYNKISVYVNDWEDVFNVEVINNYGYNI